MNQSEGEESTLKTTLKWVAVGILILLAIASAIYGWRELSDADAELKAALEKAKE